MWFKRIEQKLDYLIRRIENMTATLKDLDTAIAAVEGVEKTFLTEVSTLISDYQALLSKAAAGVDVTTEVAEINADAAKFQAAIASVQSADPNTVPAPTPTPTPAPPSA